MHEPDDRIGSRPAPPKYEGSMLLGYVIAWVGNIVSLCFTALVIGTLAQGPRPSAFAGLVWVLPMAGYAALLAWGFHHGRRTGLGVLAMGLTVVGLIVLLVAACFGIVALN